MTIPVQITFRHMESSPAVETRVRELANHLGTFSDRIQGCRVVVDSPHRHHHQGKVFNVKVQLTLPGDDVVVEAAIAGAHGGLAQRAEPARETVVTDGRARAAGPAAEAGAADREHFAHRADIGVRGRGSRRSSS